VVDLPADPGELLPGADRWLLDLSLRGGGDYCFPQTAGEVWLDGPVRQVAVDDAVLAGLPGRPEPGSLLRTLWDAEAALADPAVPAAQRTLALETALEALRRFDLPDRPLGNDQASLILLRRIWRYGRALGRPLLEPFRAPGER